MAELGLRDRKKAQTRQSIEGAALRLFTNVGFDNTTIEDIVAEAQVAPRTFFRYFATKEDVVLADYAEQLGQIVRSLRSRPVDESPWESLRVAFQEVVSDSQRQSRMLPRVAIMASAPSVAARSLLLQEGWETELAGVLRERAAGERDEVSPVLMAAAALAVMRAAIRYWGAGTTDVELPAFVDHCFRRIAQDFTI